MGIEELVITTVESPAQGQIGDEKMGIFEAVRERIGGKTTKSEMRDAEIALEKIRAVIDAPAKRLSEAEENVTQRETQLAAAEADAAARALAGEPVPDYTPIETALSHDRNTVKAYAKAFEQVRAEQEPALQAALAELTRARKAHRAFLFEGAARKFRGVLGDVAKAHAEMMAFYVPGEHPQLSVPALSDETTLEYWDEAFSRWANPPAKIKAEDHVTEVVQFEGDAMWGKYSPGDGAMLSEKEAFQAVVAGAARYSFDTPETRELTEKAVAERARRHKYGPRYADDFPTQS